MTVDAMTSTNRDSALLAHVSDTPVVADSVTAYGEATAGYRVAHKHSDGRIGEAPPGREAREAALRDTLAPGATHSTGAGSRAVAEDADPHRTAFECDLDRVRHAPAFRRLAGKTQVVIAPRDAHLRNRLTHAIEVAQVAGALARACNLNVALTEAIALGHDCGHGPAGHASEEAFSPYIPGGYDHAVWGADVTLAPLNLCVETLDGIRNHSWRRPAPLTPEGELVSWADRLAYVAHDADDAIRAGIISAADLPDEVTEVLGSRQGDQLDSLITSIIDGVSQTGRICMDETHATALDEFRRFMYERVYLREASREQASRAIAMLRSLVDFFTDAPGRIPELADAEHRPTSGSEDAARAAVTYVSSMTDHYAMRCATDFLNWDSRALPRGV